MVTILSEGVIVAAIGGFSAITAGIMLEVVKRFLSKAQDEKDREQVREEALSKGLRTDLLRKIEELSQIKNELDELEKEKDEWKLEYFRLYEGYVHLRIIAKELLVSSGLNAKEVDDIIPSRIKMHIQEANVD